MGLAKQQAAAGAEEPLPSACTLAPDLVLLFVIC